MKYHIDRFSEILYLQLTLGRSDINWYVVTITEGKIRREPGIDPPVPFPMDGFGKIEEEK